jgi:hypothetical protein
LNVDEDNRRRIFQDYWGLKSYDRQRDFICCRVLQGESNAKGGEKRTREVTRKYKFAVDGKSVRVCKKFFVATLGIGIKTVDYALKRKQATDNPIKDRRGKGTYHNKTPEVDIERIHAHIDSFPAMESLYARKDSNRKFLNNSLNIRKMYDLYVKECRQKGKRAVKHHKYREIFWNEYNLSFHVPKRTSVLIAMTITRKRKPEHWTLKMKRIIRIIWSVNKEDDKRNRKTKRMHRNIIISIQLHLILKQYYQHPVR